MSVGRRAAVIETFSHLAPTGDGWAEGLEENGWYVDRIKDVGGIPLEANLLVVMDTPTGPLSLAAEPERPKDIKLVVAVSDTPYFDIGKVAPYVDMFVSHTLRHDALDAQFEAAGTKLHHLSLAGRRMFANQAIPYWPQYDFDLCFVGSYWHGNRGEASFLKPFLSNGYRVFIAGCEGARPVPYSLLPSVYSRSKIGLNFHYPYQKQPDRSELNARTFDLALAGCFQVTDNPRAATIVPGIAVSDADNWQQTVQHYLNEPTLRTQMSSLARREASERHTWGARMKQFLELAKLS